MKKTLISFAILLFAIIGLFSVSASAQRFTQLPITINGSSSSYTPKLFTLTDFKIGVVPDTTQRYMNTAQVTIYGEFNKGSSLTLRFTCFDASGNHLRTINRELYQSNFIKDDSGASRAYMEFPIPDVTASIEMGSATPGSWNNTYYYCKYMNVYSSDGRAMGIHDLLLPVYENCGWYGPVTMYALDGRTTEIPYSAVEEYKSAGWYTYEDYCYTLFTQNYDSYTHTGNYSSAFYCIEDAISNLAGTYYENSLYTYKTNLMDAWRKKINGPLAICSDFVAAGNLNVTFRNVSYKTIIALKIQLDCYDVFDDYIKDYYDYYYYTGINIKPGEAKTLSWDDIPYKTNRVRRLRVTQAVYSDGTSWYI